MDEEEEGRRAVFGPCHQMGVGIHQSQPTWRGVKKKEVVGVFCVNKDDL